MHYEKYFKPGQRVLLKEVEASAEKGVLKSYRAELVRAEEDLFVLSLCYGREEGGIAAFARGTVFELSSEAFGLGIALDGTSEGEGDGGELLVRPTGQLTLFRHRKSLRADVRIPLACFRNPGSLDTSRAKWEKAVAALEGGGSLPQASSLPVREVNLSAGGFGLSLAAPVVSRELCLLLFRLGHEEDSPICALAEVVRHSQEVSAGSQFAGLNFVAVRQADRARIDRFVRQDYQRRGEEIDLPPFKP